MGSADLEVTYTVGRRVLVLLGTVAPLAIGLWIATLIQDRNAIERLAPVIAGFSFGLAVLALGAPLGSRPLLFRLTRRLQWVLALVAAVGWVLGMYAIVGWILEPPPRCFSIGPEFQERVAPTPGCGGRGVTGFEIAGIAGSLVILALAAAIPALERAAEMRRRRLL